MSSESRRERLEAVVGEVLEPVRRYLARRTDAATADDVLGEVLLVCWRRIDVVPDPPLPWVYGVARLALANAERGARRRERLAARVAALDLPDLVGSTVSGDPVDPARDRVRAALGRLSADDAELVRLWAWEELTPAQVAVVLGISANAAAVRLHRARARLRSALEAGGSEPEGAGKDRPGPGHEQVRRDRGR